MSSRKEIVAAARISRKKFLANAARCFAATAAGSTAMHVLSRDASSSLPDFPSWPFPYKQVDIEEARKLGHDAYYEYGCCYAGFAGILKPLQMMSFGSGGLMGWGTLCGALNGASAAISLVSDVKTAGLLIDELTNWYTQEQLPGEISNRYGEKHGFKTDKGIKALHPIRSGSPLCHVSVTRWCKAANYAVDAPERMERCARLSGDVAAQAVKLLNDRSRDAFQTEHNTPASASECLGCHGAGHAEKNVSAKMDCQPCHRDVHKEG